MTQFEKAIKTIAIVIAVFVMVVIIGGIVTAVLAVTAIFSSDKAHQMFATEAHQAVESAVELKDIDERFVAFEVKDLEVNNSIGNVTIIETDTADIHVTGKNLNEASSIELHGDKLYIESAAVNVELFGVKLGEKVNEEDIGITIEIPKDFKFESVYLMNSVGEMKVSDITAESMRIENNMGSMTAERILASETRIESGVGNVNVSFSGTMNDYDMRLEPGIGSIVVDGVKQSEMNHTNREAENSIRVEGGAGKVTIDFEE